MPSDAVIVLDFETTGLSARFCRVTEVAALRIEGGEVVDSYTSLVNAGVAVPDYVAQLTGITTRMLRSAPPPEEVMPALKRFVGPLPVVAHNAHFDQGFYESELQHVNLRSSHDPFLCTVRIARRVVPELASYSLGPLAAHCGVRFRSAAHRAMADVEVTAGVLQSLVSRIKDHGAPAVTSSLLRRLMCCPVRDAPRLLRDPW
jgi:DNA polymerase-3 subunit epsilon